MRKNLALLMVPVVSMFLLGGTSYADKHKTERKQQTQMAKVTSRLGSARASLTTKVARHAGNENGQLVTAPQP